MSNNQQLNILLAAGIYPPDLGGPAVFTKILHDELPSFGCNVRVITYGAPVTLKDDSITVVSRKQNIIARYSSYFRELRKLAKWADVIYVFDLMAAGLPCAVLKFFNPKMKLIVRLGGDYQWEKAVQNGYYDNTMAQYFREKKFNWLESFIYRINNFVLAECDLIIFNAYLLRDIYIKERIIDAGKTAVIKNVKPEISLDIIPASPNKKISFLYIGRLIAVRNIVRSIKAFASLMPERSGQIKYDIVGDGPEKQKISDHIKNNDLGAFINVTGKLDHETALGKIATSDIVVLPSLTEVNAHIIAEARALGKLIILSSVSESYLVNDRSPGILYIDPLSVEDIAAKMELAIGMVDKPREASISGDIAWDLDRVINEHLKIFNKLHEHATNN